MFKTMITAISLWVLSANVSIAKTVPPTPLVNPQTIVKKLLKDNRNYQKKHGHNFFAQFQNEQHPSITLLSCSDSRRTPTVF